MLVSDGLSTVGQTSGISQWALFLAQNGLLMALTWNTIFDIHFFLLKLISKML